MNKNCINTQFLHNFIMPWITLFTFHLQYYNTITQFKQLFYTVFIYFGRSLDKKTPTAYNKTMQEIISVIPVAYIRNDFKEKFGIPRQSGRAPSVVSRIVFTEAYRDENTLRGIESFSHLWLLFHFSQTEEKPFSPTVRPPRLGGNTRVGVFASRSPFRPNRIGLSCVKLLGVERTKDDGDVLLVSGADLLDGTPIIDIKPYIPFTDCKTDAVGGYADEHENDRLQVIFPDELLQALPKEKRKGLIECLADDPRPSYQDDPARIYGMRFGDFEIKFRVNERTLTVVSVEKGR